MEASASMMSRATTQTGSRDFMGGIQKNARNRIMLRCPALSTGASSTPMPPVAYIWKAQRITAITVATGASVFLVSVMASPVIFWADVAAASDIPYGYL